jgi:hypothetical protein
MRALGRVLVGSAFAALVALGGASAGAATVQETLQFDVALAPFCLNGTFPVALVVGKTPGPTTITLQVDATGKLTGTFPFNGDTYSLTGTQSVAKGVMSLALTGVGTTDPNAKIRLAGKSKGSTIKGALSGKIGGASVPPRSTFAIDMSPAAPMVARCLVDASLDDVTGAVTGTGTVTLCGAVTAVTLTGTTTLPKAIAKNKPAAATLQVDGPAFTWKGKGAVTLDDEGTGYGFAVSWSAKGDGVKGSGKRLFVGGAPTGNSAGTLELDAAQQTQFLPTPTSIVLHVNDASPSIYPGDYAVTVNGTVFDGGVAVDAAHATIVLGGAALDDGKNDVVVTGRDSLGLVLSGTVTVWRGTNTLAVTVKDEAGAPVPSADVVALLGDDQRLSFSGKTDADGKLSFDGVPDRTMIVTANGAAGATGTAADLGSVGTINVVVHGFKPASTIDNNDFATGDASGWDLGTAPTTIIPHVEDVGPTKDAAVDNDLQLATSGEGPQSISRTFDTKPTSTAVKLRYRFVTSEVPGGFFGTKYNDYFSVSIRTMNAGGSKSESATMNGLGLAAFDANGATDWREVVLPLKAGGDRVQIDVTVANVADGFYDSYVVVDAVREISIDLTVANATRKLLDTNRLEIVVDPAGAGSDFKMEIRRAGSATWYQLGTNQIEAAYKHRVAGRFKLRGKATIAGAEQTSPERDVVVEFPTYADIVGAAAVQTMTDAAWTSTKAAATATTRREEGFFILLDTNSGKEQYDKSATVLGPSVGPMATGSVNIVKPADNPAAPTPIQAAVYAVASFHTHTPTRFRPVGRPVGPSAADQTADTTDDVPGVVYDYVGNAAGIAVAGLALNSPAQRYHSGPTKRSTPP